MAKNTLRIELEYPQKELKNILLVLEDNSILNYDKEDVFIFKDSPKEVLRLNFHNSNVNNAELFKKVVDYHLCNIKKSRYLDLILSDNKITNKNFEIMLWYFTPLMDKLHKLDLSGNMIDKKGLQKLFQFLSSCHNLEMLYFDKNFVTESQFKEILENSYLSQKLKNKLIYKSF